MIKPVTLMNAQRLFLLFVLFSFSLNAQQPVKGNDTTVPLHTLPPDYKVPYGTTKPADIKKVLDRILTYLEAQTPTELVNSKTGESIKDFKNPVQDAIIKPGDFRLTSYEWGVTYGAMLLAGENTGDKRYTAYTADRFKFMGEIAPYFRSFGKLYPQAKNPLRQVLEPHALDDAGAICTAMIKAQRAGIVADIRPLIDNYSNYILTKEYRLSDGTLARNRPLPNTLWLDDMYMGVPTIA
jgi:rhamnogalacturonyl hydrolase YesR